MNLLPYFDPEFPHLHDEHLGLYGCREASLIIKVFIHIFEHFPYFIDEFERKDFFIFLQKKAGMKERIPEIKNFNVPNLEVTSHRDDATMKIDQVSLPDFRVISLRIVGPYDNWIQPFSDLMLHCTWKKQFLNDKSLHINAFWDDPKITPPELCRMDACFTLSPEMNPPQKCGLFIQTLPGGPCTTYLLDHWADILNSTAEWNKYPRYEIYYVPPSENHPGKKWATEHVIPLEN